MGCSFIFFTEPNSIEKKQGEEVTAESCLKGATSVVGVFTNNGGARCFNLVMSNKSQLSAPDLKKSLCSAVVGENTNNGKNEQQMAVICARFKRSLWSAVVGENTNNGENEQQIAVICA